MGRIKEMAEIINRMSGRYSAYEIFTDWIKCLAIAISNAVTINGPQQELTEDREKEYMDTIARYNRDEAEKIATLTAYLVETLEEGPDDVLGKLYMEAEMGSKSAGQFFTPFHLSELSARIALEEQMQTYKDKMTKIHVNEPSCGSGGMIIAAAKILQDSGINYQKALDVVAQDIDWKGVYMCYIQLSLLGISAICVQGDTLISPYSLQTNPEHIFITPKKAGALL